LKTNPYYKFTILGCGSSGGVPRLGNNWGNCDPSNIKNNRLRCSLLVQKFGVSGVTSVLIDTSPDMRSQLISASIGILDGVIYTHYHADHVNGIDDLRMIVVNRKKRISVWADKSTQIRLLKSFDYIFGELEGSKYPPVADMKLIAPNTIVSGPGGDINFQSLEVNHGDIDALGFRIDDVAYIPDFFEIYESTRPLLSNLKYLIIDALRYKPHPSHSHLERTLDRIKTFRPENAILTNMHNDLDYNKLNLETPKNIVPAFDGLSFKIPA
jgi:phosphoribosyl 1,2-cyclic phosphate phosphodiesterase